MAKAQKFGTFGGVFVPSVLTILGVIMYLRLGWVVGEAGLIGAVMIILVAHVISVTTGLSISSVSTDKKVKAGGIYYILSRSLGLPIGGSIGAALFVATALSIAMYIVGFGESFNNAIGLTTPDMDAAVRINYLRITGTITLAAIVAVALVSTSLAIKAQYYILGAIALSLISVVAGGLFMDHGLTAQTVKMLPSADSVSLEVIFAIFFPAVTGFTAGVAMSGDLKDSKKSIPTGTISAIAVGLVVYIGLAVFLATTIDSSALTEDTNVLSRIALFAAYGAPFLLAGIWGATLSSALGGILGGPRILQAMSNDKVTPKLFGKGVGKSNEPRNALIFTFIIAEAGVLIGQLDLIAPIVSMFYLTAYGFINLTSALQSWSGSDFRPTFKIPRVVSVIGAVATFAVMFKLDAVAMIASFIAIGFIFLYLTKKQFNLGFSDIWQGVWSEIVRTALYKIEGESLDKRNWRPNILLFSGGTEKRPYLVEYGKKLVGNLGLLSNFDLIEDRNSEVLFSKVEQSINTAEDQKGIFTRRYHCNDIYSGIESIARTYGFSGLEPNTVVMGWARYSKSPDKFCNLINVFKQLDYNILIMDYDPRVGFGSKKLIDIWWQGEGRHASFALTISRFLNTSDDWQQAAIRLIILADTAETDQSYIHNKLEQALEELRISVEVKIINTALEHRAYYEIIQSESAQADLIYLELPELQNDNKQAFFEKTDALCHEIGTVVLYRAANYFEDIDLGLGAAHKVSREVTTLSEPVPAKVILELSLPNQSVLAHNFQTLDNLSREMISEYFNNSLEPALSKYDMLVNNLAQLVETTFQYLIDNPSLKYLPEKKAELQSNIQKLLESFRDKEVQSQEQLLIGGYEKLCSQIDMVIKRSTPYLTAEYPLQTLLQNGQGTLSQFSRWQKVRNKIDHKPLRYKINYKKVVAFQLQQSLQNAVEEVVESISKDSAQFISKWQKQTKKVFELLYLWEEQSNNGSLPREIMVSGLQEIQDNLGTWITENNFQLSGYRDYLLATNHRQLQEIASSIENININNLLKQQLQPSKSWKITRERISEGIVAWGHNQWLFFNTPLLELQLSGIKEKIAAEVHSLINQLKEWHLQGTPKKIGGLIPYLEKLRSDIQGGRHAAVNVSFHPDQFPIHQERLDQLILKFRKLSAKLPEQLEVANLQDLESNPLEEVETISISPNGVVNFLMQNELVSPLVEYTEQQKAALDKASQAAQDVIRVISFSVNNLEADATTEGVDLWEPILKSIDDEVDRLRRENDSLHQSLTKQEDVFKEKVNKLLSKLDAFTVVKLAVDLDYLLRTQQKTEAINRFSRFTRGINEQFQNIITKLYYRRSVGLLAAEKFSNQPKESLARTEDIIRLIEISTPLVAVLEKLPYYYKQLFLKDHSVDRDLWLVRKRDLIETKDVLADYQALNSGAILITGEPGSGKTFYSDFVAYKYANNNKVYHVNPPAAGSIEVKLFIQTLQKSLHFYGDIELAFNGLEKEAVIIFNDIELWWERSEHGMRVIDEIASIIDRFGNRCLMIFNMNKYSFDLVNSIKRIDDSFIRIMNIQPFNAEELKEVISKRHQTSRLKFILEGTEEDAFSKFRKAKLFNQYFNISQGNVGVALQSWISNIRQVIDGQIEIRWPEQPNEEVLHHLEKGRLVILLQFLLHRRLNRERLQRIMQEDPTQLDKELQVLVRSGILVEENQVLSLNRYLRAVLINAFVEDSLI